MNWTKRVLFYCLMICAVGICVTAYGQDPVALQTDPDAPEGSSPGTIGEVVYSVPYPGGGGWIWVAPPGWEMGDDLHLSRAGSLVSFTFSLWSRIDNSYIPDYYMDCIVRIHPNDPNDGIEPGSNPLVEVTVTDIPTNMLWTQTVDLPDYGLAPVPVPEHIWMTLEFINFPADPWGYNIAQFLMTPYVFPTIGYSHDVMWFDYLWGAGIAPTYYGSDYWKAFFTVRLVENEAPTCDVDLTQARNDFYEPSPGSFVVTVGETITVPFTGNDVDDDYLWATLSGLPPEATLTPVEGSVPLTVELSWTPTVLDLAGAPYDVEVTFSDDEGATATCGFIIEDINQHPTCDAGPDQTVECDNPYGMEVTLSGTGYDPDPEDTTLMYHWDVSNEAVVLDDPDAATTFGTFPLPSVTMATLTVTDGRGGVAVDDVVIIVQDDTPPEVMVITDVAALWPPKHDMRTVTMYITATDACAAPEYIFPLIVTVRSDEEDDAIGEGDGSTIGDVNGEDGYTIPVDLQVDSQLWWIPEEEHFAGTLDLRAERCGDGDGRSYIIDVGALDSSGNWAYTSCCVVVPHDRRGKK
jgi:hypothetical protein